MKNLEFKKLGKECQGYKTDYYDDYDDQDNGLIVTVTRKSDKRKFQIALAELEAVEKKSANYRLLHDFSVWFWNNR